MTHRRSILLALALFPFLWMATLLTLWLTAPKRFTREQAQEIHPGMSFQQVLARFGPPGNYIYADSYSIAGEPQQAWMSWMGRHGIIEIKFDAHYHVENVNFRRVIDSTPELATLLGGYYPVVLNGIGTAPRGLWNAALLVPYLWLAVLIGLWLCPPKWFRLEPAGQIRPGMSLAQVQGLLGPPCDPETTEVKFDAQDQVVAVAVVRTCTPESLIKKVLRWFRW